jgi:hypothetical protein
MRANCGILPIILTHPEMLTIYLFIYSDTKASPCFFKANSLALT